MSDLAARAMLARNTMNIYLKIPKFLISTKLTYGSEVPYITVFRHFLVSQFGPITTRSGGNGIKGEYFYQCIKALQSTDAIWLGIADNYVQATPVKEASLETIADVSKEYDCNMYTEEFFQTAPERLNDHFSRVCEHFDSPAKMIHYAILNGFAIKNFDELLAMKAKLDMGNSK